MRAFDRTCDRPSTLERIAKRVDTFREEIARRTDTSRARSSYPQHPVVAAAAAAAPAVERDEAEHARNFTSLASSSLMCFPLSPFLAAGCSHPSSHPLAVLIHCGSPLLGQPPLLHRLEHSTLPLRAEFAPSSAEFDLTLHLVFPALSPVRSSRSILTLCPESRTTLVPRTRGFSRFVGRERVTLTDARRSHRVVHPAN